MLTQDQKTNITETLKTYIRRFKSQNQAVNSLKGISAGTISQMLNGKWDNISEDMWLKLRSQIAQPTGWQICQTNAFRDVMTFLSFAQNESSVVWVTGPAGIGKTTAARIYDNEHRNVFVLPCSEDMHKADFVKELASKIGVDTRGLTVRETLSAIITQLVTLENPLLVFDEGDKLTDSVLYYYISLYNAMEDKCGMVFLSTAYMEKRIAHGVQSGKKGYDELESRISRKFVPLSAVNSVEIEAICRANGLEDAAAIRRVQSEASGCGNDLRRVKESVKKERRAMAIRQSVQG